MKNTFDALATMNVGDREYTYYRLDAAGDTGKLPYSLKILLENLLRREDGESVTATEIRALVNWDPAALPTQEIAFMPARVLMQDFTGVPAIVDFAAMRDAILKLGGDPASINPLVPAELVIDHSVQVDAFGTVDSFQHNADLESGRNRERYAFLKWGQKAFSNFRVVPPDTGIVHQINLEHLARAVFVDESSLAYPDTLIGTDSHTTMINGLGVLGWGVGGIEAEAAMLGQPVSMLIPKVVGFELAGRLPEGATATDLVLTIVEMLRAQGVVGKFVEFFGDGLDHLPLADRATIANMAPEYGATCGLFPIDAETLSYMRLSGRPEVQVKLVEAYAKKQGMYRYSGRSSSVTYSETLKLNIASIVPSLAGPKRPQDRIPLDRSGSMFAKALCQQPNPQASPVSVTINGEKSEIGNGAVVIASITSCTNTSNPSVMMAAGLLARKAVAKGLKVQPWVKTSLAPGSRVVTGYLDQAGLTDALNQLGFYLVGYGCATCIGNSGPLPAAVSEAIASGNLAVCSVLSGNRNFEGRVHGEVRMNYLASPPLVVAYALAGRMDIDLYHDPLGADEAGKPVFLKDIWPTQKEISDIVASSVSAGQFRDSYSNVFTGDARWQALEAPEGDLFSWDADSTYVRNPPYFEDMSAEAGKISDIRNARVLAMLGDSVTTDHISPAGNIRPDSAAGSYLIEQGIPPEEFNSYGSRRGNHEVMMRGTFANVRLQNFLAPGSEGSVTRFQPGDEQMSIYDAAMRYRSGGVPLIIIAGKEYGSGSSRDWAAKGPALLGVRVVIAASYERIHRSNLIGMGILPLQFVAGDNAEGLHLSGHETFSVSGLTEGAKTVTVAANGREFSTIVRIDTPKEWDYYRHGGILKYVLRQLSQRSA